MIGVSELPLSIEEAPLEEPGGPGGCGDAEEPDPSDDAGGEVGVKLPPDEPAELEGAVTTALPPELSDGPAEFDCDVGPKLSDEETEEAGGSVFADVGALLGTWLEASLEVLADALPDGIGIALEAAVEPLNVGAPVDPKDDSPPVALVISLDRDVGGTPDPLPDAALDDPIEDAPAVGVDVAPGGAIVGTAEPLSLRAPDDTPEV